MISIHTVTVAFTDMKQFSVMAKGMGLLPLASDWKSLCEVVEASLTFNISTLISDMGMSIQVFCDNSRKFA